MGIVSDGLPYNEKCLSFERNEIINTIEQLHKAVKMVNTSGAWLVAGLMIGILMAWLGIVSAIIGLPLSLGWILGRDYHYRPGQPLPVSSDLIDRINRQSIKLALVFSVAIFAVGGIVIGLALAGARDWALYVFAGFFFVWMAVLAVYFAYVGVRVWRERSRS